MAVDANLEAEKNKKAFLFTTIVCALMILAAFYSWPVYKLPEPPKEELLEVNLGNMDEGMGTVQPLIKGDKAPDQQSADQPQMAANNTPPKEQAAEDDSKDEDAAPVTKAEKPVVKTVTETPKQQTKVTQPTAVVVPTPKPQKPKIAGYGGTTGTGNGADQDNGYRYQGNNPNGRGDAGSPNGNPDSYGKTPGGKIGGLQVSKGDRKILRTYIFVNQLEKATINAIIKVSPDGKGTYVGRDKGSTTTDSRYTSAIISYLPGIQFDKADHESIVTVPFNFTVNN